MREGARTAAPGGAVVWKFTLPDDQVCVASDTKDQSGVCDCTQGVCVATHINPRMNPSNEPLNEPTGDTQHIEDLKMRLGLL